MHRGIDPIPNGGTDGLRHAHNRSIHRGSTHRSCCRRVRCEAGEVIIRTRGRSVGGLILSSKSAGRRGVHLAYAAPLHATDQETVMLFEDNELVIKEVYERKAARVCDSSRSDHLPVPRADVRVSKRYEQDDAHMDQRGDCGAGCLRRSNCC